MTDRDILLQVMQYHRYLMHVRSANPKHPLYARAITGNIIMQQEYCDTIQLHRITRYIRKWLKTLI